MKIGTDSVLLAACIEGNKKGTFLDVGTGSGVIALILAQNNAEARIDAVEIDEAAYLQARQNFEACRWTERLKAFHYSIQDFAKNSGSRYDLIVCNPPFFRNDLNLELGARKIARQEYSLSFGDLARNVELLLADEGEFYCILPTERMQEFLASFKEQSLHPLNKIYIRGKEFLKRKRVIICLGRKATKSIAESEIVIYQESGEYTEHYKRITQDLYLKF